MNAIPTGGEAAERPLLVVDEGGFFELPTGANILPTLGCDPARRWRVGGTLRSPLRWLRCRAKEENLQLAYATHLRPPVGSGARPDWSCGSGKYLRSGARRGHTLPELGSHHCLCKFSQRDPDIVRIVVGGMGVLFLLSGLFLALMMSVFGFPYEGRGWEVGLGHAALGALTMSCAVLLPCAEDEQPPPS